MIAHKEINGAIAQLGERLHGMQEVGGSIPPSSTKETNKHKAFKVGGFSTYLVLIIESHFKKALFLGTSENLEYLVTYHHFAK